MFIVLLFQYESLRKNHAKIVCDHLLLKTKRIYIATNAPSGVKKFGEAEAEERRSHSLIGTQPRGVYLRSLLETIHSKVGCEED